MTLESRNVRETGATGCLSASAGSPPTDADRWQPWLLAGMTALFVARTLYPTESAALEGDGLPMVMLWLALAVFWLLAAVGQTRDKRGQSPFVRSTLRVQAKGDSPLLSEPHVRLGWTAAAVLVMVALHTVAAWAGLQRSQRPALNMLWEWIGMGVAFLLARQFIVSRREARAVVAAMIATAAALSALGLYQCAYEFPKTRSEYAADPEAVLRAVGLPLATDSPERLRFESRLQNNEPLAAFALTNTLAGFLTPWLIVGAGIVMSSWRKTNFGWRVAFCLAPVAACLALTRSRSGYIAAAVGLTLAWIICRRDQRAPLPAIRRLIVGAVVAIVLGAVAWLAVTHDGQLAQRAAQSFGYRWQYWRATLPMIADHPWVGVGPGNFQNEYTRYKLPEASEEVSDPHNFLLEIGATAGIPTAVAFLAVLATFGIAVGRVSRNPPENVSQEPEGHPGFVAFGALGGFLLAMPLSMISTGRIETATLAIGLPVAAGCLLAMRPWIDRGELPGWLPAVGIAVLLIDLSTTGGISFPGVAGTLWLLLALGLNLGASDAPRWMPRRVAVAGLGAAAIGVGACYLTGYSPVMYGKAELRKAQADPTHMDQYLLAAGADDPWEVRPWNLLALRAFADWERDRDDERLLQFEQYSAEGLRRDPRASPAWFHLAECRMKVFERTGRRDYQEKAVQAYRTAVELYPNNGVYHGRLALALRAGGDESGFRHEADRALDLDESTFHVDKKLPTELRRRLLRSNAQTK